MRTRLAKNPCGPWGPSEDERNIRSPRPSRVIELASAGIDEGLLGIGGSPFGRTNWVGLRVPFLVTSNPKNAYLFQLCSFDIPDGQRATLVGYRQLVTIGANVSAGEESPPYHVELQVTSPFWHFADGRVSFHIMRLGPTGQGFPEQRANPSDRQNFLFQQADGPALLFQTATPIDAFYVDITSYTPPNGGRPPGTALEAGLQNNMPGLRTTWETSQAWNALDVEIEGPDKIAMFASVVQTNPQTRPVLTPPNPFFPAGVPPEELFLLNFPSAIYWRVGGSLIVNIEGDY
jgi:hypothetical protein